MYRTVGFPAYQPRSGGNYSGVGRYEQQPTSLSLSIGYPIVTAGKKDTKQHPGGPDGSCRRKDNRQIVETRTAWRVQEIRAGDCYARLSVEGRKIILAWVDCLVLTGSRPGECVPVAGKKSIQDSHSLPIHQPKYCYFHVIISDLSAPASVACGNDLAWEGCFFFTSRDRGK